MRNASSYLETEQGSSTPEGQHPRLEMSKRRPNSQICNVQHVLFDPGVGFEIPEMSMLSFSMDWRRTFNGVFGYRVLLLSDVFSSDQ